ncbi:MAG: Endoglucanase-like protein [Acidimicrobiaceae bacterium]|nr:Endoglucanase-like protein [Acidimicrobiaceae bacterium]
MRKHEGTNGESRQSKRRSDRSRRAEVEQREGGAILVLALAYIMIIGVVVAALTTWASGDLNNTGNFSNARSLDYSLSSAMEVGINNIRYTPVVGSINASPPVACWGSGTYATTSAPTYSTYSTYQLPTSTNNIALWCSTLSVPGNAVTRTVTVSACPAPSSSTIATVWATSTEIQNAATACDDAPDLQAFVSFDDYNGSKSVPGYGASLQNWDWSSSVQSTILPNSISIQSSIPEFPVANSSYVASATASSGDTVAVTTSPSSSCTVSGHTVTFVANGTTCNVFFNDPGGANYAAAAQQKQTISVGQVANSISVTSTDSSAIVGGQYTPTASATSGDPVVVTVDASTSPSNTCTVNSGTVTFYAAGSCVLDFNDFGNTDYVAATQFQQTITVGLAPPAGQSILGNPSTPASGGPSNGDSLTYQYNQTMSQSSMYSGFTGSASVCVDLTTSGLSSSYQTVWTVFTYSSNTCRSTLVNLGSVNLGDGAHGNYVSWGSTAVFLGTMTMSTVNGDSQVIVTLGNESNFTTVSALSPNTSTTTLTWTPSASATSTSGGTACSTTSVTEANAPKVNF